MGIPTARSVIVRLAPLFLAASLAACGSDGQGPTSAATDSGAGASGSTTAGNPSVSSLSLSGSAPGTAAVGASYSFQPQLVGSGSAVFSIRNRPTWAMFDVNTGTLSGSPAIGDVGTYPNVVITAASGATTTSLAAFAITVSATSAAAMTAAATLSWNPPTNYTDGSSLADLAGYRIYYGTDPASLGTKIEVNNPGATAYTVANLGSGTHHFAISAFTSTGAESELSAVGSATIM